MQRPSHKDARGKIATGGQNKRCAAVVSTSGNNFAASALRAFWLYTWFAQVGNSGGVRASRSPPIALVLNRIHFCKDSRFARACVCAYLCVCVVQVGNCGGVRASRSPSIVNVVGVRRHLARQPQHMRFSVADIQGPHCWPFKLESWI